MKAQPNAIMLRLGTLMVVLTGIILAALRYCRRRAQRMSGAVTTLSRHRTRCAMSPIDASNREDGP